MQKRTSITSEIGTAKPNTKPIPDGLLKDMRLTQKGSLEKEPGRC